MARFSVWLGTAINAKYNNLADIAQAVELLKPRGRWTREVLWKAGEAGTWQAAWDDHPLALHGPKELRALYLEGRSFSPCLTVTPYIVVRGRQEWNEDEWWQIAACAAATGRVVLNLEDGPQYWNGPIAPDKLRDEYLEPLVDRIHKVLASQGRPGQSVYLQVCAIPRTWSIADLGGVDAINTWLSYCQSASWECYDAAAPDLDVALSMQRLDDLGVWGDEPNERPPKWRRIPVVQRSRIDAWAYTKYARHGLQVWFLDGD